MPGTDEVRLLWDGGYGGANVGGRVSASWYQLLEGDKQCVGGCIIIITVISGQQSEPSITSNWADSSLATHSPSPRSLSPCPGMHIRPSLPQ